MAAEEEAAERLEAAGEEDEGGRWNERPLLSDAILLSASKFSEIQSSTSCLDSPCETLSGKGIALLHGREKRFQSLLSVAAQYDHCQRLVCQIEQHEFPNAPFPATPKFPSVSKECRTLEALELVVDLEEAVVLVETAAAAVTEEVVEVAGSIQCKN